MTCRIARQIVTLGTGRAGAVPAGRRRTPRSGPGSSHRPPAFRLGPLTITVGGLMRLRATLVLPLTAAAALAAAPPAPAKVSSGERREARTFAAAIRATIADVDAALRTRRPDIDARRLAVGRDCYDVVLGLGNAKPGADASSTVLAGYLGYALGDGLATVLQAPAALVGRLASTHLRTPLLRRARTVLAATAKRRRPATAVPAVDFCGELRRWSGSGFTPGTAPGAFAQVSDVLESTSVGPQEDAILGATAQLLHGRGGLGRADAGVFQGGGFSHELDRLLSGDPIVGTSFLLLMNDDGT